MYVLHVHDLTTFPLSVLPAFNASNRSNGFAFGKDID